MLDKKTVLIWDYSIEAFVFDHKTDGIALQLYFWAQTFHDKGWEVYSLSKKKRASTKYVTFIRVGRSKFDLLFEWFKVFRVYCLLRIPNMVVVRGADRKTFPIALISRLFHAKFVFFAASDVNFMPGKEQINGLQLNRTLYQKSIRFIPYIVVQNNYQKQTLFDNYGKTCLSISNIWKGKCSATSPIKSIDVIWIANLKRLKRAEWMVEVARKNPYLHFALIGGSSADKDYYQQIEHECSLVENLTFYGLLGFNETNELVSRSRILACTSEFEGFPNTFLQAWAFTIPVVSTVDPSHVIVNNNLGIIVESTDEFNNAILHLLDDGFDYNDKCHSIKEYFLSNHSADSNYDKLMFYLH